MIARLILVSAVLVSSSAFAADAPKTPARAADQQQPQPQVVLASADVPANSATTQAPAAPKRPRVARVTTCRCGGQETGEQAPTGQ